ncbi:MAG: STAS domain-containing protein [Fibrobacterota bacterium]
MNETLTVKKETRRTCHVIRMSGALSVKNILNIRTIFDETLKNNSSSRIALDLSAVDFLDSMGVGILINFSKRLAKDHGQMVVINPSEVVREIFDVADTGKFIRVRNATIADLDSAFD